MGGIPSATSAAMFPGCNAWGLKIQRKRNPQRISSTAATSAPSTRDVISSNTATSPMPPILARRTTRKVCTESAGAGSGRAARRTLTNAEGPRLAVEQALIGRISVAAQRHSVHTTGSAAPSMPRYQAATRSAPTRGLQRRTRTVVPLVSAGSQSSSAAASSSLHRSRLSQDVVASRVH